MDVPPLRDGPVESRVWSLFCGKHTSETLKSRMNNGVVSEKMDCLCLGSGDMGRGTTHDAC